MDRLVRARVLLAEAQALGLTIDDLVAASTNAPRSPSATPTVAEYVETVVVSFSNGTAATYKSYWRLAVDRLGDRPVDQVGVDDCEAIVAAAVARAKGNRPGTDGRSARENCIGALRALFARAERAGLVARSPAAGLEKPRRLPSGVRVFDRRVDLQSDLVDATVEPFDVVDVVQGELDAHPPRRIGHFQGSDQGFCPLSSQFSRGCVPG